MELYSDGKEIIQDIVNLAKSIDNMDLKNKILELQNTFYELNEENENLRLKYEELERVRIAKSNLSFKENAYIDKEGLRYCSNCLDVTDKLVTMHIIDSGWYAHKEVECPSCKTRVTTSIDSDHYKYK